MQERTWISIRDGQIVGTPFGPEVPNGKYQLVEKLNSEGGGDPNGGEVPELTPQHLRDLADGLANQNHEAERVARLMGASSAMLEALREAKSELRDLGPDHPAMREIDAALTDINRGTQHGSAREWRGQQK